MATHEHESKRVERVRCAVVTVSDTRTVETDKSGSLIRDRLAAAGHDVVAREIVPDDPTTVSSIVTRWCDDPTCDAVLLTGGTGIAARDTTTEAIAGLLEKRLDGFGELFRVLSFEQIGAAAMLSQAMAGVRGRTLVFSMPGATGAVALAMDRLILPQLPHAVALVGAD
jgi:molybdenum cofactor biosynthesis protein B